MMALLSAIGGLNLRSSGLIHPPYSIASFFIFIFIVSYIILKICTIKNPDTINISTPDDHFSIGCVVESQIEYNIKNGVVLSVDAANELSSVLLSANKISSIANDLISLAEESQAQGNAKDMKKLIIPANALCGANFEDCATYDWIESSSNYLSTTQHKQTHKVIIVKSMGFHMIYKTFELDVYAFEVTQ